MFDKIFKKADVENHAGGANRSSCQNSTLFDVQVGNDIEIFDEN